MLQYKETHSENREVISLFSGAMGMDLGLMKAGLNISLCQDADNNCVNTMVANGHKVLPGDIRSIRPYDVLKLSGMKRGHPFLLCGGPPCQPFSTAGRRLGINDPRGSLFMDFIKMIDYIRPRFFIMENVKGLLSASITHIPLALRSSKRQNLDELPGSVLDTILSQFTTLGYHTVHGVLDAVNYGSPQFRERFILIGSRDSENIFLPSPTHFQMHQEKDYRWKTLYEAISDLEDKHEECATFSQSRLALLKLIPEGGNWRNLPQDLVQQAMGGAYASGGGKVGFFRRLSYHQPAPTLVTSPVQKASMLCHPKRDRPLSVKEYARIQQFPDNWVFTGSTAIKYKQIGNAVPTGLAYALAQSLLATASGEALIRTKRMRGTKNTIAAL